MTPTEGKDQVQAADLGLAMQAWLFYRCLEQVYL